MKPTPHKITPPSNLPEELGVYFAPHRRRGRFFMPWGDQSGEARLRDMLKWGLGPRPWAEQKKVEVPLQCVDRPLEKFAQTLAPRLMWLGHASFMLEIHKTRILIDPVFGKISPVTPRKCPAPFPIEQLPTVDYILMTHGHYDHLDRSSLKQIAASQGAHITLLCPLGLSKSIPAGFQSIIEVDWWDRVDLDSLVLTFLPSQHWHKRTPFDADRALWGGWMVQSPKHSVYHIGDSGYFGGFEAVSRIFPQIDLAILPIGAYEPRWFMQFNHMNPTEALQVFDTLNARHFVPMHWGTFDLSDEPLRHGAELLRNLISAQQRDPARFHILDPGETMLLP